MKWSNSSSEAAKVGAKGGGSASGATAGAAAAATAAGGCTSPWNVTTTSPWKIDGTRPLSKSGCGAEKKLIMLIMLHFEVCFKFGHTPWKTAKENQENGSEGP